MEEARRSIVLGRLGEDETAIALPTVEVRTLGRIEKRRAQRSKNDLRGAKKKVGASQKTGEEKKRRPCGEARREIRDEEPPRGGSRHLKTTTLVRKEKRTGKGDESINKKSNIGVSRKQRNSKTKKGPALSTAPPAFVGKERGKRSQRNRSSVRTQKHRHIGRMTTTCGRADIALGVIEGEGLRSSNNGLAHQHTI